MQRLTLLLLTLSCSIATAQTPTTDEELEVRRYTVELVIFAYTEDVSIGTERFVPDRPAADEPIDIVPDGDLQAEREHVRPPQLRDLEMRLLTRREFTMSNIVRRFEQLDAYKTVMHIGWTQATLPQDETATIDLRALGVPPAGLDGSFSLYLSRYLHLVVDLALDEPPGTGEPVAVERPGRSYNDRRSQQDIDVYRETGPVRYRIQENRIFKSGDIRYFDHPKFGIVAKVTRVEEDDTDGRRNADSG